MSGKILIIDERTASRIVLKVQLSAWSHDIRNADSAESGLEAVAEVRPDLVMVSSTLPDMQAGDLCRRLRMMPATVGATVIVLAQTTDRNARVKMLTAGADDVFLRSQPEVLLLARLRCMMRARSTDEEMRLRESTTRALGMSEAAVPFEQPGHIAIVARRSASALEWHTVLSRLSRHHFMPLPIAEALRWTSTGGPTDIFAIDLDGTDKASILRLVADIRSRADARHAEILLLTADQQNPVLADALDLGASAVMPTGFDPREAILRFDTLLRRKRAAERMRRQLEDGLRASITDPLTGLYNRRYALPHLERLTLESAAAGRSVAVILADLDHFKRVNDEHGHSAGDSVLIAVADLLRDNLRARDLVARFGGEEFLIVMPETGRSEAQIVADRLRSRLAETAIGVPGQDEPVRVTISVGVCVATPAAGVPAEHVVQAMIDRADRALYAAKANGRNAVTLAAEEAR